MDCKCGRSPTGKCIGWHKLSDEEYQEKLKKIKEKDQEENQITSFHRDGVGRFSVNTIYATRYLKCSVKITLNHLHRHFVKCNLYFPYML